MRLIDCYLRFLELLRLYNYDIDARTTVSFEWFLVFRKRTQAQKMWWHLKLFNKITSADAEDIYGFRHPPSIIRDIRKKLKQENSQYWIENITKTGVDRWGNACKYDEYTLNLNFTSINEEF